MNCLLNWFLLLHYPGHLAITLPSLILHVLHVVLITERNDFVQQFSVLVLTLLAGSKVAFISGSITDQLIGQHDSSHLTIIISLLSIRGLDQALEEWRGQLAGGDELGGILMVDAQTGDLSSTPVCSYNLPWSENIILIANAEEDQLNNTMGLLNKIFILQLR